jgi:two-component system heavy metal sensor histidine kinase CusS
MSSKSAHERRPWSLAFRLTLWYAGSAFALLLVATGYLYWALASQLEHEDDAWLAAKAADVRHLIETRQGDEAAIRREVSTETGRREERIFVRVGTIETPGMAEILPVELFPPPGNVRDYQTSAGRVFKLRSDAVPGTEQVVQAAIDRSEDAEVVEEYRRQLVYVLALGLLACAAGGYWIARRGVRPVEAVAATAQRISPAHLNERIDLAGLPRELRDLANTFNAMLDRLADAFERLSQFSADIAHELRTPVQNLRGEVEVVLSRSRTPDEYRDTLGSCLEEASRLARLIDSLLFLARAENPKTALPREPLDAGAELATVAAFFEATASEAGVTLKVDTPEGAVVHADRTLFQRAVGNLVTNALAHTPSGGSVTLRAIQDANGMRVDVQDTGSGIAPEDLPYVFDRFFRVEKARTSTSGRVGLGLAIVKGIMEAHGGAVSATSTPGAGTTITLHFPSLAKMTKL